MAIIEPFTQFSFESIFDWHNIKIEYTFRNRLKTALEMGTKWFMRLMRQRFYYSNHWFESSIHESDSLL